MCIHCATNEEIEKSKSLKELNKEKKIKKERERKMSMRMKKVGGGVDMKGIYAEYECKKGHRIVIHSGEYDLYFSGWKDAPDIKYFECQECEC